MKNKKAIYLLVSVLAVISIVLGINMLKDNTYTLKIGKKAEETQLGSKKIFASEYQKYDDSSEYTGSREYIFDEKNNIIYAKMKNTMGEMEFYYKVKGKKVDMYSKSIDDKEFSLEKDIDIENSPVQGILDRFNIEKGGDFVELDKEKDSEKYKVLVNKKANNNTSKVSLSEMSDEERKNILEDLKTSEQNYEKFSKENRKITIFIDKKTNKVVKTIEDSTENALLNYYMTAEYESEEKRPVESKLESNYYYKDIKKISIPQKIKEN